jgi:uncharacterized protein (TIGR02147 family)
MTLYDYTDYKAYLRDHLKNLHRRGAITELARVAGCSHSYLSQVLSGKPELTSDQAMAATDFLQHDGEEAKYFLTLVLLSRASTPKLRKHFEAQLKAQKMQRLQLKSAVSPRTDAELDIADRDFYYSSCNVQMIHTLTACPDFQSIAALTARLNLTPKEITETLDWLAKRHLVKKKDGRYLHSGKNIHLPTASIHTKIHHLNWRLRGLESSADPEVIHYTSTFAIDRKDADKLRADLLSFIEKQREGISNSGSQEIMTFCCDLF